MNITGAPLCRRSFGRFASLCGVVCALATVIGFADEEDAQALLKKWYAFYEQDAAGNYELYSAGESQPLRFDRTPILRWTNPLEDGQIHGAAYVWSKDERPIVVGQLFSYLNGKGGRVYCHAFHSLAETSLEGRRHGKAFWKPETKGLDLQSVPKSPAPATSRLKRLSQMREIARRVGAYTEEASRGKRVLRLMPQPLYRYPEVAGRAEDGAIFSLAVGNDPELLVVIESVDGEAGFSWKYGFARSTRSSTVATLDDREVWRYEQGNGKPEDPSNLYLSVHGIATLPLEPSAPQQ